MPDISIFMITYNHELFIAKAIEAVLMQQTSYTYQLVIGEDCSTDGTRKICEEFAKKHPDKITLLPSLQNYGMVKNCIRTLEACTGKYIALCEGDDYWIDKNKLQTQVDFLENNTSYSLCFHDTYSIAGSKKSKSSTWDAPDTSDINYLLSHRGYIATSSVVFLNHNSVIQFLKTIGNPPYLDFFIYVAVAQYGLLKFFSKKMSVYRVHEGGVWSKLGFTKALEKTVQGYQLLYKKVPDSQKNCLKIKYLTALEDYFLNTSTNDYDVSLERLTIKEMDIEPYMVEFIKQNCEMRKKVSHYVTAVPSKTLLYSIIQKIKNKF